MYKDQDDHDNPYQYDDNDHDYQYDQDYPAYYYQGAVVEGELAPGLNDD